MSFGTLVAPSITTTTAPQAAAQTAAPVNVLVFHGPAADQKDPVVRATDAIAGLAQRNGMNVAVSSDPAVFSAENLARFRGVVMLSAEGLSLTGAQETALQNFIKAGNGYLGVADAAKFQPNSDWFTGLVGARPVGALTPPIPVADVGTSGENPPRETAVQLTDNDADTKWLTFAETGWVTYTLDEPAVVTKYSMTSANDFDGRDPANWTLQASTDGTNWVDLDARTDEEFPERFQLREFELDNTTAYAHFRLDITANRGESATQLADWGLYTAESAPPPEPEPQESVVNFTDRHHPATAGLPMEVTRTDKWTNWDTNPLGQVHTVAQVEERHYDAGPGANGPFHPISWCRDYDGGRSFYTGMGHTNGSYGETAFRTHLLGALKWTTGMVRADCKATIASNYKVERLTAENQPGELDQIGEPHGLTIAPEGTVFYVGKAACAENAVPQPNDWTNPDIGLGCGTIHQWDPEAKEVKLLATLDVMGNRGSGGELVKNEEGLLGLVTDPNWAENGWLWVYWMPHESIDRENRIGKRTISRFTYDHDAQTLDLASRVDVLEWDAQIHSCCHAGGGMAFDKDGNLYIGSGDNNSSQGSDGYSGNNWTAEYKGVSFQDARRTSGNTNDLNGKVIRIHPEADGTYTIPEGNLFPEGTAKTRPEIYAMGVRNISRLQIDPEHNWLTTGWVGPDASAPNPELGPAKYETATIMTEAGNHGWPYCMGNKQPYRDRSNTDAEVLTGWYDCDNPLNTSPRNTGLINLPPIKNNMIWYAPDGGGPVFPNRPNSNVPTYNAEDATYTQPYLKGGGQAVMSGPTYHYDRVNTDSGVAWPKYWDDKWFIGDQTNPQNRVAVTVNPEGVPEAQPPVFAEDLRKIIPLGGGDNQLNQWMDAKFGPDGALYVLDYGGGFFSVTPNQKLLRITYQGGGPTPATTTSSVAVQDQALTHRFNGLKAGGVSWLWEFGDGTTSTEANPTHTYKRVGPYTAKLTVTYADGETATIRHAVNVGCVVSDPNTKVTFLDANTTVNNKNVGAGCKIDDLINDEVTWDRHRPFVRHVKQVTKQLRQLGIINANQKAKLDTAAEESEIGRKGVTGYETLFNGTPETLRGWEQAPSGSFSIQEDGFLRSSGGLGMLWYADKAYGDFSFKAQFRDMSPEGHRANTGMFTRFPDPRTPLEERPPGSCGTVGSARNSEAWVAIYCGHEIQIYDGESGEPQKTGSIYNFDPVDLDGANPTDKGVWNEYEVRVVGQHYTIIRDGIVINEFDNTPGKESSRAGDPPTDLRQFLSGYLGLQNHGNNDVIEFRNIRVREL
ncbi:ThuA domain-containing protein [Actinophytocola sp. S1-96]|uniref:ThuA domain-containing protein n=2 Tax=Actinophytocola gossypii TaxID=2812003 RepID=A0ABT2J9Q9_9PSEU|nr:ThuA domain-containing protein [Actinophytocola gossypii]MCT2584314.1 ThuA domain-containing protein [Actinophytocola gossypii]